MCLNFLVFVLTDFPERGQFFVSITKQRFEVEGARHCYWEVMDDQHIIYLKVLSGLSLPLGYPE